MIFRFPPSSFDIRSCERPVSSAVCFLRIDALLCESLGKNVKLRLEVSVEWDYGHVKNP